jgi:hypothetical protein
MIYRRVQGLSQMTGKETDAMVGEICDKTDQELAKSGDMLSYPCQTFSRKAVADIEPFTVFSAFRLPRARAQKLIVNLVSVGRPL